MERRNRKKGHRVENSLGDRDNALKASIDSRDSNFKNSLGHCKQSFRLMSFEIINNRTLLESPTMR